MKNNLTRKLISTSWGADLKPVRTPALAFCYSKTENAALIGLYRVRKKMWILLKM